MNVPDRAQVRSRRAARLSGLVAALATSSVVSWLTPDGNLLVTLVPGMAMGLVVLGLVSWWYRRGDLS